MTRRYVSFFPAAEHPYDVLLDDYEPGMKTAEVRELLPHAGEEAVHRDYFVLD